MKENCCMVKDGIMKGDYVVSMGGPVLWEGTETAKIADLTKIGHKELYRLIKHTITRDMPTAGNYVFIKIRQGKLGLEILIGDRHDFKNRFIYQTNCQTIGELGIIGILEFALGRKKFLPDERRFLEEAIDPAIIIHKAKH